MRTVFTTLIGSGAAYNRSPFLGLSGQSPTSSTSRMILLAKPSGIGSACTSKRIRAGKEGLIHAMCQPPHPSRPRLESEHLPPIGMGYHMATASRRPPDSRLRSSTKSGPSGSRIASGRSRLCRSRISNASYERDGEQVYTIDVIAQHLQPAFGQQGSQPSLKLVGDLSL